MTKVIILGEQLKKKDLKPIEFLFFLSANFTKKEAQDKPKEYKNIVLIGKNYSSNLDLMFAHDGDTDNGTLYLGHFNDGVV